MVQDELSLRLLECVRVIGGSRNRNSRQLTFIRIFDGSKSHFEHLHFLLPCSFLQSYCLVWSVHSFGFRHDYNS